MTDPELERFKREIDLTSYAAAQGYQLDHKQSWNREKPNASRVMRHAASDDKIIIKRLEDGHYCYCSARNPEDNGSIIDFIQRRQHMSLGAVRKELRPWIGKNAPPLPAANLC